MATSANGGSDANSGTSGSPYLTLSHAISQATCGYTISVGAGTFTDDLLDLTTAMMGCPSSGSWHGVVRYSSSKWRIILWRLSSANTITFDMTIKDYDEVMLVAALLQVEQSFQDGL